MTNYYSKHSNKIKVKIISELEDMVIYTTGERENFTNKFIIRQDDKELFYSTYIKCSK